MDELYLSDTLQRYFSDVFLCCDEEKSGKATLGKTVELIKSGNVPDDVISQVTLNAFNRENFTILQLFIFII